MSGETVTVACKLPHGLQLRTFRMEKQNEAVPGGGFRQVPVAVHDGWEHTIRGMSAPAGMAPKARMLGGYALTPGVDKEHFELWAKQNADSDFIKNGLVFAHTQGDTASMRDHVKENAKTRSGLEPIDPKKLPPKIETADEMSKEAFAENHEFEEV